MTVGAILPSPLNTNKQISVKTRTDELQSPRYLLKVLANYKLSDKIVFFKYSTLCSVNNIGVLKVAL